ncbi:hypothetical protein H2200_008617 [Cladophialophora chaetospira]|uniref:D-mandelate dehydrogenase n=1 Tax=Cladophialophora chaetospira TaxID=386627 RepID=A0AA39CFR4_9EURO|nr:hypothetical protein H2200_008617 [Cladophialophora chaetospira]
MGSISKPILLQLGEQIIHNPKIYERLNESFIIIQPRVEERERASFMQALQKKHWGDFQGMFRPSMDSGGEMGLWDDELVSLLPESMKIFASAGAGFEWVDTERLAKARILYCNGGNSASEAVAEMAMFHILSTFRNLNWSQAGARSNSPEEWLNTHKSVSKSAHNLHGHVLGIIGLGNIGYRIAKKAYLGFGMRIHYYDTIRKSAEQESSIEATYASTLEDLLAEADCVVLATPFGGRKMINGEVLAEFKRGARFVNIARGALVDEEALIQAVLSGHISAIGLDVFENEPVMNQGLFGLQNATLTCHNAGGTVETFVEFERLSMENVEQYLLQGQALTPVNLHLLKGSG